MHSLQTSMKRELSPHFNQASGSLTVDKRAMYIMALEITKVIDGQISEDNKKTWLTVEEFREKARGYSISNF